MRCLCVEIGRAALGGIFTLTQVPGWAWVPALLQSRNHLNLKFRSDKVCAIL